MTKARDLANIISTGVPNSLITLDAAEIPNISTDKLTTGTLPDARIADLAATKLTGTINNARISLDAAEIPNLDTAKITTGTLATARLGSGTADATTFLRGDGAYAAAGGGKLLQAQTTVVTGRTGITSGDWTATPLTVNITPAATSSKILVMTHFVSNMAPNTEHQWTFFRDSTNLGDGDSDATGNGFFTDSGAFAFHGVSFMCLDSPSSTSEVTYAVYGKRLNHLNGGTQYLGGPSDSYDPEMNIIAMEIGA